VKTVYRPNRKAGQDVRRKKRPRDYTGSVRRHLPTVLVGAAVFGASFAAVSLSGSVSGFVKSSISFPLAQVRISGNSHLSEDRVLAAADVSFGENLLDVDLEAIRERLMSHPLVRSATIRRKFPSEIVIAITERTPAAVVFDGQPYVVDAEGYVMALPGEGETTLPCLRGLTVEGRRVAVDDLGDLEDGMMIIGAIREAGFPKLSSLECIDLGRRSDAILVPRGGRPLVHVGRTDVAARLRSWEAVVRDMAARWQEVEYVDLRAEGMVVAKPLPPAEESGPGKDEG
jgi:cell division protein FtsQ